MFYLLNIGQLLFLVWIWEIDKNWVSITQLTTGVLTGAAWFFPDTWENSALVFNKNENGGFGFVMFQFKNARFEVWTLGRILFVALTSNSCL
jgi:hypothetical protein